MVCNPKKKGKYSHYINLFLLSLKTYLSLLYGVSFSQYINLLQLYIGPCSYRGDNFWLQIVFLFENLSISWRSITDKNLI